MTPEEQKGIARQFFEEVWKMQKLDTIEEVFANGKIVEDWSRTSSRSCSSWPAYGLKARRTS